VESKGSTDREGAAQDDLFQSGSGSGRSGEIWTAILFLLVIITAISLGIVVGWSNGRKATARPRIFPQSNPASWERNQIPTNTSAQDAASASTDRVEPSSNVHREAKSLAVPAGGLVVTENGKVIYRSADAPSKQSLKQLSSTPGGRQLIHRVEPVYPSKARAERIEGMVVLELEIAEDGSIANAAVISGDPLLASAAVQAVKQWQYQPGPGGVASRTRVRLQFTLPVTN